jgi:hypothetical protein
MMIAIVPLMQLSGRTILIDIVFFIVQRYVETRAFPGGAGQWA